MPVYALATIPLVKNFDRPCKQVWYADDAVAVGRMTVLCVWWKKLTILGPKYGHFPNPSKTWLVTKEGLCHSATSIFDSTGVNVTPDGRPYLRAAIGSPAFISTYVETKVAGWIASLRILGDIALSQLHAAYSALTHELMSKRTYLSHTIPDIAPILMKQ